MGHTNETDELLLSLFSDNDKPTWRGDVNSDHHKIDEFAGSVRSELAKTEKFFFPENYDAVADGVADDRAAIQACIDAAHAAKNGTVVLRNRYGWTGDIIHRGGVTVRGMGRKRFLVDEDNQDRGLVALSATARYVYGNMASPNSQDDNPGALRDLIIDGNNLSTELVFMDSVDGEISSCTIINSVGDAVQVGSSQNSTIRDCVIGYSGKAIHFMTVNRQGAGNIKIDNTYFGTSGVLFHMNADTDQFQPHDIIVSGCLFENYEQGNIAVIDAGVVHFNDCVFTNSNAFTMSNDAVVKITQTAWPTVATVAVFNSCWFNGGANADKPAASVAIYSNGVGNHVRFNGHTQFSNADACIKTYGAGVSAISMVGTAYRVGQIPWFAKDVGANLSGLFQETATPVRYTVHDDATMVYPFTIRRYGDVADRFRFDKDGGLFWFNGVDGGAFLGRLYADPATGLINMGGSWNQLHARRLRMLASIITEVNQVVSLSADPTGWPLHLIQFQLNNMSAVVDITGGGDGSQIQILVDPQAGTTGNTIIWHPSFKWAHGKPPAITAGQPKAYNFTKVAGNWVENTTALPLNQMEANRPTDGQEIAPKDLFTSDSVALVSGQVSFNYFTAYDTQDVTALRTYTGTTAAGATPTLCKMGLYSVAANGDLTLMAATANTNTLWNSANASHQANLTAPQKVIKGNRYAFGLIIVTAAALPTVPSRSVPIVLSGVASPRTFAQLTGQTDLPNAVAAGVLSNGATARYGVLV